MFKKKRLTRTVAQPRSSVGWWGFGLVCGAVLKPAKGSTGSGRDERPSPPIAEEMPCD